MSPTRPVILDAYAAIRCPVKVHNYHDRTVRLPDGIDAFAMRGSSDLQQELFGGRAFVDHVLELLVARPDAVDLRPLAEEDWTVAQDATRDAVRAGVRIIVGPRLPVDPRGHRRGSPPVLVRGTDQGRNKPGYLPVQVRTKRMLERHSRPAQITASPIATPLPAEALDLVNARFRTGREDDQLHLAHFWRLLEAAGWQAGDIALAGVIGNDALVPATHPAAGCDANVPALELLPRRGDDQFLAVAWLELGRKQIRTFSRTSVQGWKERSALERYDHEHTFRVKVAQVASKRNGGPADPRPMVAPIFVRECSSCVWWQVCAPQLGDDDLSMRIDKSPLDVREISVLRSLGIRSVHDLVDTNLDALLPRYLPEVRHRPGAEDRLRLAARRARMIATWVELERTTTGAILLPVSELEVDWDIETSANDKVYLWGFLVRHPGDPDDAGSYHGFAEFTDLDEAGELALAARAMSWLRSLLAEHPSTIIYHYSDYEMVHLRKLASGRGPHGLRGSDKLVDGRHVDLFEIVRQHFFGAHGLSLKVVAHAVAGFSWRDDTPGGLNSQQWFAEAVHADDAQTRAEAAQRILDYNEDDVRATAALRDWLRKQT